MSDISHVPQSAFHGSSSAAPEAVRIQLAELVGSGRHGMVFRGTRRHGQFERDVAIKVPGSPDGLDDEQRALVRFSHPHIIELLDGPLSNGALVLEFCDLGTLADRLSEETLDLHDLRDLLTSLVPALAHIHDQGWIHGDISPGNIGLRTDSGPVLLDFATARPADGSAIDEGTAEFAGPHRQADPRLDIRSLAATTLRALGDPDRWDHRKRRVHDLLTTVIDHCDSGSAVGLDQLSNIASLIDATDPTGAPRVGWSGDGPDAHSPTRAFGPRPTSESSATDDSPAPNRRRLMVVGLLALALTAISLELPPGQRSTDATSAPVLTIEESAAETLAGAGAMWNVETGVLTLVDGDGSDRRFAAGTAGDVAAIADWSCDGEQTLGVYRPTTGSWFVFDSWDPGSSADVARLDIGTALTVRVDPAGCAQPVIR